MSLEDDIAFLEGVPTLALLGRPALRILAIGAEARKIPSGAVLYYAGDLADAGYLVQEGSFLLEPDRPGKGDEVIAEPGTLLGELALVTDTVHTATEPRSNPRSSSASPARCFSRCWRAIRKRPASCGTAWRSASPNGDATLQR